MKLKSRHVGIVTKDLDRSIAFYRDLLNFSVVVDMREDGPYLSKLVGLKECAIRVAKLAAPDGFVLEIMQFVSHEAIPSANDQFNHHGFNHICFETDDIEAVHEKLAAAGVRFISRPQVSPYDPVSTAFYYDPDDSLVQFVQIMDRGTIREGLG
jgi:lactoylglutathione lyase